MIISLKEKCNRLLVIGMSYLLVTRSRNRFKHKDENNCTFSLQRVHSNRQRKNINLFGFHGNFARSIGHNFVNCTRIKERIN